VDRRRVGDHSLGDIYGVGGWYRILDVEQNVGSRSSDRDLWDGLCWHVKGGYQVYVR